MSQNDSFHNGPENLELQRRNRRGQTEPREPAPASESTPADGRDAASGDSSPIGAAPTAEPSLPPHERPYVNIYAENGNVPRPAGSRPASSSDFDYGFTPTEKPTEPHQRPYVSIYSQTGDLTYTAGAQKPSSVPRSSPEQRDYTAVYAKRVAERTTPAAEPGVYGNTPDMTEGAPYYADMDESAHGSGVRYTANASSSYAAQADDEAERSSKNKFNVASLILGIASFAGNVLCLSCLTPITAILAIIFACIGRVGGKFEQKGLVGFIAGIVYCAIMLLLLLFIFMIFMLTAAGSMGAPY